MVITEAFTATHTTTDATAAPAATGADPIAPAAATIDKAAAEAAGFRAVPVWFFAFEGLMGAAYDIAKSSSYGWIVVAVSVAVNIVLARTVLRGRLKMAKAMLKGKRTRTIALGLIALRVGVHVALGAIGMQATSGPAHLGLAVVMCATTVALLAFDQRVMLRALAC